MLLLFISAAAEPILNNEGDCEKDVGDGQDYADIQGYIIENCIDFIFACFCGGSLCDIDEEIEVSIVAKTVTLESIFNRLKDFEDCWIYTKLRCVNKRELICVTAEKICLVVCFSDLEAYQCFLGYRVYPVGI